MPHNSSHFLFVFPSGSSFCCSCVVPFLFIVNRNHSKCYSTNKRRQTKQTHRAILRGMKRCPPFQMRYGTQIKCECAARWSRAKKEKRWGRRKQEARIKAIHIQKENRRWYDGYLLKMQSNHSIEPKITWNHSRIAFSVLPEIDFFLFFFALNLFRSFFCCCVKKSVLLLLYVARSGPQPDFIIHLKLNPLIRCLKSVNYICFGFFVTFSFSCYFSVVTRPFWELVDWLNSL